MAQARVSLPVQHVLEVLRNDPELVRTVKKAVIEQAAEEGRIIQSSELTDDALFRMIEEDANVAVIATEAISTKKRKSLKISAPEESDVPTTAPDSLVSGQPVMGPILAASAIDGEPTKNAHVTSALTPMLSGAEGAQGLAQALQDQDTTGSTEKSRVTPSPEVPVRQDQSKAQDKPVFVDVKHPYARIPELDDLYKQVATGNAELERFGANIFRNGTGNADDLPMDMPVGPEYVVGPGDGLKIELWGGMSQRLQRVVDREGRVGLPEVGMVQVAGRSLADAQQAVLAALRTQFRDVKAEISLTRLRSVRVYVVGDVERPGAYDLSALSTPLNALYAAGGPTARGSMRTLRHYRGRQLIQEVDVYDLVLHGMRSGVERLEAGDTVLVPPVGREVAIEGMVRRPAIYELRDEQDLARTLELAGGVLPAGAMRHIEVERVEAHEKRTALSFDLPEGTSSDEINSKLAGFAIQDGDRLNISPIVSYSERSVYVDGHVFNPGKRAWHEGMTVRDVITSYSDLLPEPYRAHAEIVRLVAPDFHPEVIAFNLGEALEGKSANLRLQPFDTVRVFGRYDFEDAPDIRVSGEVRDPGVHRTNGETRLRDAIFLAGGLTPDALMDSAHIFRPIEGSKVRVIGVNLRKAMEGDEAENIVLAPRDQVIVHRNIAKVDPAVAYINGQVAAPGRYPLGEGMTASELVRLAGGFRRGAYTETADLTRASVTNAADGMSAETQQLNIGKALSGEKGEDIELRDGDVLAIRQISGWEDIGASIALRGEVAHPGTYGITPGERLSSVIKRAGGFYRGAYPAGAVLSRVEVRQLEEKSKTDLIERLEEAAADKPQFAPGTSAEEQGSISKTMQQQQKQIISTLKRQEVEGRLVLKIGDDIRKWENTPEDIEVRNGDELIVPKRPTFVLVSGQVYNHAAITWSPGKTAGWYLRKAGGPTESANKKDIFVIRADGSVMGKGSDTGFWSHDVLSVKLQPGDAVVVPERIMSTNSTWRSLLGSAQMMSAVALTAKLFTGL